MFIVTAFFCAVIISGCRPLAASRKPGDFPPLYRNQPLALWFGIINGIIWGAVIWAIARLTSSPDWGRFSSLLSLKSFPKWGLFLKTAFTVIPLSLL